MFLHRYLLCFIALPLILLASDAILEIEGGGHTGRINKLITTKNKDIITCSGDKTIKIWNKEGKLIRRIDGQIGLGNEGQIFAMALSPDEKYLAVGGYMSTFDGLNHMQVASIRLYDYENGKLLRLLQSHTNVILGLSFSHEGKYLLSGSHDKTVKLWDLGSFTPIQTINFHTSPVYDVKFIKKDNKELIVSVGLDNKIALHSLDGKLLGSYTHSGELEYISTKENEIATCGGGNEILIFDSSLNLKTKIKSETKPSGLSYSHDGRHLITGASGAPYAVNIYDTANSYSRIATFNKHSNLTNAVGFMDNIKAVSAGGTDFEINIWNINDQSIKTSIIGDGKAVWEVAIGNRGIAWSNKRKMLEKYINMSSKDIFTVTDYTLFKQIDSTGLSHSKGGESKYADAVLTIKPYGTFIIKDTTNGQRHRSYGWWNDNIISAGNDGKLKIYNKQATEVANLIGHNGDVLSLALDGDRLVSGSSDQTIRVWDLGAIKKGVRELRPTVSIFIGSDNEWVMWTPDGFFNASKNGAKYIGYHINRGAEKEAEFVRVDKLYNAFYRPDLVEKALRGESLAEYAASINIQKLLEGGFAPRVGIKTHSQDSKARDMELKLEVCDKGGGYDNLTLMLNGMPISVLDKNRAIKLKASTPIQDACYEFTHLISLTGGVNNIGFKATNKTATIESNTDEVQINYIGAVSAKPTLHILAVGIDKYRDGDLQLKYSVADAKELSKSIQNSAKGLFEKVYSYELLDKDVTKDNIIKKFAEIGAKTARNDVFVLYIAGHGITDKLTGSYYYLPVDFRYKNDESVRNLGISQEDFKLALSKIQAMKSITLIDTCNSGSFAEAIASRGVLQKTAIDKLTRATGRATLVASSKDQVALEGFEGHGVFTYTLMEALNGKAYKNGKITIKQLATYVEDVLPDRTYKKWGYEQIPQSNITGTDFPIGIKQ